MHLRQCSAAVQQSSNQMICHPGMALHVGLTTHSDLPPWSSFCCAHQWWTSGLQERESTSSLTSAAARDKACNSIKHLTPCNTTDGCAAPSESRPSSHLARTAHHPHLQGHASGPRWPVGGSDPLHDCNVDRDETVNRAADPKHANTAARQVVDEGRQRSTASAHTVHLARAVLCLFT